MQRLNSYNILLIKRNFYLKNLQGVPFLALKDKTPKQCKQENRPIVVIQLSSHKKNITTSSCSVQSHSEEDKQLIESTDPIISTKISNEETSISVPASSDQKLACQPSESDSAKKTGNESGRKD